MNRDQSSPRLRCPWWPALLLLALALTGCTGTFEEGPPTLLVVGFDDGTPQVGLVEDTFRAFDPTGRELTFVAGSARTLPEPAVAIDVVDRAGTRPTAVVLARGAGEAPPTYLRGFSLAGIDPATPAAFAEDPSYAFTLANGGTGDPGILDEFLDADYCLIDAQISSTGRYLAVFEDRVECGGASFRAAYVLDLAPGTPPAERVIATFDTANRAGLYLDPTGELDPDERETVYFVDEAVGLRAFHPSTGERGVALQLASVDASAVVDLGRIGDAMVLVESNAYVIADLRTDPPTSTRIDSASGLTSLVPDPLGNTDSAVLFAGDALVVHDDATADAFAEESTAPARTGASLEPIDRFVYLLGDERIGVFDLLTFAGTAIQVRAFSVPEIPAATVVTWTRAAPATTP